MNSQQFIIWMRGFTEGVHDFNITPKQWDILKEKLGKKYRSVDAFSDDIRLLNPDRYFYGNNFKHYKNIFFWF